jgi:putative membrane protein
MMWSNDYGPSHWMYYGPMFMVLMTGVCVLVMYIVMRAHFGDSRGDTSTQILKDRFARGEIDKAEFDDHQRTLQA